MIHKVTQRPIKAQAAQFNSKYDWKVISDFCHHAVLIEGNDALYIEFPLCIRLKLTDWLIYQEGQYKLLNDEAFRLKYDIEK